MPNSPPAPGELVAGTFRWRLTLNSDRFALIDNGLGFALVPWTPALDRHLGHHVAGVAKETGGRPRAASSRSAGSVARTTPDRPSRRP